MTVKHDEQKQMMILLNLTMTFNIVPDEFLHTLQDHWLTIQVYNFPNLAKGTNSKPTV